MHVNNPKDQPGRVEMQFNSQQACEQALSTITYELKFKNFKIEGHCQKS